jgi:hypothetical protein
MVDFCGRPPKPLIGNDTLNPGMQPIATGRNPWSQEEMSPAPLILLLLVLFL